MKLVAAVLKIGIQIEKLEYDKNRISFENKFSQKKSPHFQTKRKCSFRKIIRNYELKKQRNKLHLTRQHKYIVQNGTESAVFMNKYDLYHRHPSIFIFDFDFVENVSYFHFQNNIQHN